MSNSYKSSRGPGPAQGQLCTTLLSTLSNSSHFPSKGCAYLRSTIPETGPGNICSDLENPSTEPGIKKVFQERLSCSPKQTDTLYSGLEKCLGCTTPSKKKGLSTGAIIGIVVGSLFVIILIIIGLRETRVFKSSNTRGTKKRSRKTSKIKKK